MNDYGLNEKVEFIGFSRQIDRVMRESSIFVLTSRHEGFGMVLAEAMSQGCACISFNCEAGPSDIIDDGVNGILVSDQNNAVMESVARRLIADNNLQMRLAMSGLVKAKSYSATHIANRWIELFDDLGIN